MEQASALIEHAPDALLLTVEDGDVLAVNAAAEALLGRTADEIRAGGRDGMVVMNAAARRFLEERHRTGRARGVITVRGRNGTNFFGEVASTLFSGPDGRTWSTVSFHDVTERERTRHTLEVLAEAGAVLPTSLDPQVTLDMLTKLVVPRLADVCTVDMLDGDGVTRVALAHHTPERLPSFAAVRRRKMHGDADAGVDFTLRTGRPSWVPEVTEEWLHRVTLDEAHFELARALDVRSFVTVPLNAHGRALGAMTLMSDGGVPSFGEADVDLASALAARAAIAIDNAQRHAEVIEARRLRDDVLAIVAHDLRGPLANILLTAEGLAREHPTSRRGEGILRSVRRANTLVGDLLLATKCEAGTLPLELHREGVASIVDEVHALHAAIAVARQVELTVRIEGGELAVALVDRHRILQVLSNLVANAIDVTPPGGHVELRAHREPTRLTFAVSDSGVGIAPDEIARVFDRFWQSARRRRAGAGLGLTIARANAAAHGGDISVASEVGRGTTFTVVLPLAPEA